MLARKFLMANEVEGIPCVTNIVSKVFFLGSFCASPIFLVREVRGCFPRSGVGGWYKPCLEPRPPVPVEARTTTGFQQCDPGSADLKAGQGTP